MVIDPDRLLGEIDELIAKKKLDEKTLGTRLTVSDRAHTILPYHVAVDTLREKGEGAIGTTKRGVGPCYEDKAARRGIPLGALRDLAKTEKLVASAIEEWTPVAKALGGDLPSIDEVMRTVKQVRERLLPRALRRRARDAARFGSRHVSFRHVLHAHVGRRMHRLGRRPHAHRSRHRFGEGVHDARRRRSVSHRAS
jgi:adenylosuccinate synthase